MSSRPSPLLSATFVEPGYDHLVELIHQRDAAGRRRLESLDLAVYDPEGKLLLDRPVDTGQEVIDLAALAGQAAGAHGRVMVTFDARYDERVFPYRPHHYAYLHRRGSTAPPLYYAVNAVLGGVPDRIGVTNINNFETYVFRGQRFAERYSLLLGCVSRWAPVEAQVFAYYGAARTARHLVLNPKSHVEVVLDSEREGERLTRVELKALFRLATYVVGRRSDSGDLVLFDHLFTYFK
jgi:hypothetical protein